MQKMKKKASNGNGKGDNNGVGEVPKPKERHIVSWSQEEDDILREQIRVHGTDNWTIIASKFKDKTTRQCRRRWYTYLNSDFKKGGWSPEEDMLLCEAQKIFGNRWTEIAKVVSGRTDNAVKNRFSTLCKKRAKHEALAKENNTSFVNLNNKRVIFPSGLNMDGVSEIDGVSETTGPNKKMRIHISNPSEDLNNGEKSICEYGRVSQLLRPPFAVLAQNFQKGAGTLLIQQQVENKNEASIDAADNRIQGTFLKKDDPKILALMQQAELLSNLALKVNSENTDQSLENAWQALHDYLSQTKESETPKFTNFYSSFQLENIKDFVEDLRSSNEGSRPSLRQSDLQASSPDSSEYSTGSTLLSHVEGDKTEQGQAEQCPLTHQDIEAELQTALLACQNGTSEGEIGVSCGMNTAKACMFPVSETLQATEGDLCQNPDMEFSSPIQVTPLFRSLAAAVPTPNFSESERHFLLKTLGLESTSPNPTPNPAQPPPCKRVLLHSL